MIVIIENPKECEEIQTVSNIRIKIPSGTFHIEYNKIDHSILIFPDDEEMKPIILVTEKIIQNQKLTTIQIK